MGVHLRAKFEVSSIILTGFRQGFYHPKNEPLKSPPRLGLIVCYIFYPDPYLEDQDNHQT